MPCSGSCQNCKKSVPFVGCSELSNTPLDKDTLNKLTSTIKQALDRFEKRFTDQILENQKSPEQKLENLIGNKLRVHVDEGF